jgi:hypothetical protein
MVLVSFEILILHPLLAVRDEPIIPAKASSVAVAAFRALLPISSPQNASRNAHGSRWQAWVSCLRLVCQPEAGQPHPGKTNTESLECRSARDGLGHLFGQFIEFVVHGSPFVCACFATFLRAEAFRVSDEWIEDASAAVTLFGFGAGAARWLASPLCFRIVCEPEGG